MPDVHSTSDNGLLADGRYVFPVRVYYEDTDWVALFTTQIILNLLSGHGLK